MTWIHPLPAAAEVDVDEIGAKGHGLGTLLRLGLPVPPGFIISTAACRAFLRDGRLPDDLDLAAAIRDLETATGRRFGGPDPLAVSVRSGSSVSMPGMMNTVLNLGLAPGNVMRQLEMAITAVFSSWNTPRAITYRTLYDIPHELGTAVTVQAMVFGNRDTHSGTGVAFSRDPNTGENIPFGEVLFGCQGDAVVSGTVTSQPLSELDRHEPAVSAGLRDALKVLEKHYRDVCYVEFTFESGQLWLLQVRSGGLTGRAAIRVAVDLADEGAITRSEALLRISPQHLQRARTPRMDTSDVLTRGLGACPGVATGRIATTADNAVRMAADGPVILVRPHTSPLDLPGLAAAAGIVTTKGGPASHAAVVARSMGKPAVVSASVDTLAEGTLITIDGTSGEVAVGRPEILVAAPDPQLSRLLTWADEVSGDNSDRTEAERLGAAHSVLRR